MKKLKSLIEFQEEIVAEVGKEKRSILYEMIVNLKLKYAICVKQNLIKHSSSRKHAREEAIKEVKNEVIAKY